MRYMWNCTSIRRIVYRYRISNRVWKDFPLQPYEYDVKYDKVYTKRSEKVRPVSLALACAYTSSKIRPLLLFSFEGQNPVPENAIYKSQSGCRMSNNQNGIHSMAFRPTSLDFINRPNPVEPHAVPEKHPLNDTPRLEKTSKEEFLRLLLDKDVERPAKRRKSGEPKLLDLPKLPAVRNGAKRLRIPPTLSGLHQPPPDAGLLPSMSVEQPLRLPEKTITEHQANVDDQGPRQGDTEIANGVVDGSATHQKGSTSKRKHNKWSDEETACLLKGVAKFGIGQWTKILACAEYHFEGRTALDLKDRFRVCCPDDYRTKRKKKIARPSTTSNPASAESSLNMLSTKTAPRARKSDSVSSVQLQNLGIDKPFEKSTRRRRTGYSGEEDEALLRGFKKHGNGWAAIRNEEEALKDRTATDLRDRFRTRYPDEYAKFGLAPRPEQFPKKAKQGAKEDISGEKDLASTKKSRSATKTHSTNEKLPDKENKVPNPPAQKRPPPISLLQMDDVFWAPPFEPDDADSEPITLDRGILDWAFEMSRPSASNDNVARGAGIDPLSTLNLPRPTATNCNNAMPSGHMAMSQSTAVSSSANTLPSVAAITSGFWPGVSEGVEEQLELPSLLSALGGLESDGRTGGHFMSMDELLS